MIRSFCLIGKESLQASKSLQTVSFQSLLKTILQLHRRHGTSLNKHWGLVLEWLVEDREENPGQTDPVQTGFRSDARQACIREISSPVSEPVW